MKESLESTDPHAQHQMSAADPGTAPAAPETSAPETDAPETGAPETGAPESGGSDEAAFQSPRSIAPVPQLSSRGLFLALVSVCLLPLIALTAYAVMFGRASEHALPVTVTIDRQPLPTVDGQTHILEDVVMIQSEADFDITNLTVNLNGQYFLYQDKPLLRGESLLVRQAAFATKSSQRWVPGRYRIDTVTVTGKLPSGARGVTEVQF